MKTEVICPKWATEEDEHCQYELINAVMQISAVQRRGRYFMRLNSQMQKQDGRVSLLPESHVHMLTPKHFTHKLFF